MKTCTNCGSGVKSEDLFCGNCGAGQATTGINTNQDALTVAGFGGASALTAGPSPHAASAITQVRTEPSATTQLRTEPPAITQVRTEAPAAAAVSTASPVQDPPGPDAAQEAYFASTRSSTGGVPGTGLETPELKYMRQTRNATVFIAVIVGVFTAIAVIGVIWTAVTVSKLNSEVNGFNNGVNSSFNSNCASQGGTNTNC
jgi:cobalamin biosynthesis Mg chelatase CobN